MLLLEEEKIPNRGGMFAAVDMTTTYPGDRHHFADWQGWEQLPRDGLRLTMSSCRTRQGDFLRLLPVPFGLFMLEQQSNTW